MQSIQDAYVLSAEAHEYDDEIILTILTSCTAEVLGEAPP